MRVEPSRRARLVLELGGEQLGHEVVRGVLRAPVDVVGEHLAHRRRLRRGGLGRTVLDAEALVELLADRFLVLLRDAEQHADRPHRHRRAEVTHEVEAARTDERIERAGAELADLGLDGVHLLGREHARQQAAMDVVDRRVLEEDQPGRQLDVGANDLEDRPAARPVGLPVDQGAVDVGEAAQRVEVVLLVVVERRLVAQLLPDRVRIRVDLEVVRVVVDGAAADRHGCSRPRRRFTMNVASGNDSVMPALK